jgi:hypothetical protein
MNFYEIRRLVQEHITKSFEQFKENMKTGERMDTMQRKNVQSQIEIIKQALARGSSIRLSNDDTPEIMEFINNNNLRIEAGTEDFQIVKKEYAKGMISLYSKIYGLCQSAIYGNRKQDCNNQYKYHIMMKE